MDAGRSSPPAGLALGCRGEAKGTGVDPRQDASTKHHVPARGTASKAPLGTAGRPLPLAVGVTEPLTVWFGHRIRFGPQDPEPCSPAGAAYMYRSLQRGETTTSNHHPPAAVVSAIGCGDGRAGSPVRNDRAAGSSPHPASATGWDSRVRTIGWTMCFAVSNDSRIQEPRPGPVRGTAGHSTRSAHFPGPQHPHTSITPRRRTRRRAGGPVSREGGPEGAPW